jgi:hypothetical protein
MYFLAHVLANPPHLGRRTDIIRAQVTHRVMKVGQKAMKDSSLGAQQFTASDFLKKLLSNYAQQELAESEIHMNWEKLRADVACRYSATPSCLFLANE